jgi:AmmeMemoRadiSam system protein A
MPPRSDLRLSDEDRCTLLALARQAISDVVFHLDFPDLPPPSGRLAEPGAAFVSVRCNGNLRGCIGRTSSDNTLAETVAQCAISAALQDPRFRPVGDEEMAGLQIEISVLSELLPLSPEQIQVGVHGILVVRDANRGLLLPQVAVERYWSAERFLEEGCRKAGLPLDAWRDPETKLYAFGADVFSEAGLIAPAEEPIRT